jgi:hypothetical protein
MASLRWGLLSTAAIGRLVVGSTRYRTSALRLFGGSPVVPTPRPPAEPRT